MRPARMRRLEENQGRAGAIDDARATGRDMV